MEHWRIVCLNVSRGTLERQMNFNEFYAYCEQVFKANTFIPAFDEEKIKKLYSLTEYMLDVNQRMNLTAIKDVKAVILKHYADSLAICQYISEGASVIDVGCGAGFPTLPLAIFRPDVKIHALDSTSKRIEYVRSAAKLLGLENVQAISERAESLANNKSYREIFDYATARAVASLPILAELCLPFVRVGGKFIAMKSQKTEAEISDAGSAIKCCGGSLGEINEFMLSDGDQANETRTAILIDKASAPPKDLPRDYAKIKTKPL